ncbi:MAG: hypothetical protein IPI67_34465 [Myxococcales bacterium]|nr:hypothetical protein [Myxococcales bacterium]
MSEYWVDSDAFHCLRKLAFGKTTLLSVLMAHPAIRPIVMAGHAAHHELNSVQVEVSKYEREGALIVRSAKANDSEYKRLRRETHKGEAEAIVLIRALERAQRPVFVTRDAQATATAQAEGLRVTDVFGVVVELIQLQALSLDDASVALAPWDDRSREICRPRDWNGFDATLRLRQARGYPYS